MAGGGGAVARFKGPLNRHGIAALVAGQHHVDGGQVRAAVGFGDLDVQLIGLPGVEPRLATAHPSKGIGLKGRFAIDRQLIHEQLVVLGGTPRILNRVP